MFDLSALYYPITANPSAASEFPPSRALQPYIRCFWGTVEPHPAAPVMPDRKELVIPDSCMDIIWHFDPATGQSGSIFCGINDAPFEAEGQGQDSVCFGIRFHFWAVHFFADEHLREALNVHADVEQYFASFRNELSGKLLAARSMAERIAAAEVYLLRRLERSRRSHDGMMNAIHMIVNRKGVLPAKELEHSSGLSSRQLERLFHEYIGVTPKKAADLVRFQNVWRDLYYPAAQTRDIHDIVFAYGFSHQSHLINSFRNYSGLTPLEALAYAGKRMSIFCNTKAGQAGTLIVADDSGVPQPN